MPEIRADARNAWRPFGPYCAHREAHEGLRAIAA